MGGGESYWLWCFWFKKKCFDVGNWTTKRGSCVEESVSSTVLQGPIHWPPGEGQICRGGGETGQVCGESDETYVLRAHQPGSGLEGNSLVQSGKKINMLSALQGHNKILSDMYMRQHVLSTCVRLYLFWFHISYVKLLLLNSTVYSDLLFLHACWLTICSLTGTYRWTG